MARKKRVNKIVVLIVGVLVVLAGLGLGWHFRQPIKDYFFPKDAAAIEARADASYEADEYQEAMERYRRAAYWYKRLGKLASRDRAEFKQARAQLYIALKAPDLTDTVRTEHYGSALRTLGNLLRRSPKYADPQRLLCDIAWGEALRGTKAGTGPWAKCVEQCTKLLVVEPNDHQSYFRRGYANARLAGFMKGQYFAAAEDDMRKAIELKSDMADYWMELARFLQARKMPDKAEGVFRAAMAANPDNAQLAVMYSVFLRREDRSDDALRELEKMIKLRPNDTLGYIALASFYRAEGDTGQALRILAIAKKIDDSDFRIYGTMAAIHSQMKKPEKVVETLRMGLAAIQRRSQSQPATQPAAVKNRLENARLQLTVMLANALLDMVDAKTENDDKLKLMKETHEHFSRIEEMAPKSAAWAKVAGRIALAEGNMPLAVKRLEEAYANYRTLDAKTVSLLVSLYLRQGLRGKAEEILDRILKLRRNAGTLVLKATLLIEYRQYDRAKGSLRDALRIEPRHVQARNLLMALIATDGGGPLPDALEPTQRVVELIINRTAEMMLLPERRQRAVRLLEELHKKTPKNQIVIGRLVNTYLAMGTPDKAKEVLEQAIEAQPDKAERFKSMLANIGVTPRQRFETRMAKAEKIEDKLQSALTKAAISAAAREPGPWLKYLKEAEAIAPTDARVVVQMFRYGLSTKNWKIVEDCVAKAKAANLDGCGGKLYAADMAIARADFPQAIAELKAALKDKSGMKRARVMLGQCYLRIRDLPQAREAFGAVARDDPGYASAAVGMARVTEVQGKWSEHADWVNTAYRLAPANPYVRERYLQLMAERSRPEEIIKRRVQILLERPEDMQNRLHLAGLYERANRLQEAEKTYRAIFASNLVPRRFRANVLASFYARRKRFGEVDSIYSALLTDTIDPTEKVAMYVEWGWLLSGHSGELAIAAFTEAIKVNEKDPRGHLALGQYLGRQRQWAEAVTAFVRYLKLNPQDRATERRLAGFLIEAKRFDEAADRLQKLIAADASDAIAMTLRGVLKMRQGDLDAAEKAFNQVITENPNYGAALVNRAQLYLFRGEHSKAKMDLRNAGRLTNSPTILMQLARFYVGFRDYDSAQLVFQDILARNKNHALAIRGLMGVYMVQKSWARLESLIAEAKKSYPKNVIYVLAEGDMWRVRGDISRAVAAQSEAFKLAPNSPTVIRVYLLGLLAAGQYQKILDVSQPYANKEGFASWVGAINARALVKLNKPAEAEKLFVAALQRARPGEMSLIVQQVRETYGLTDSIVKLTGWLTARPKSWDIYLLLGNLHVQANQAQQGIEMYQKAFGLADKPLQKAEAKARMGGVYHKYGNFPEAEKAYLAALAIIPNHSATLNNLAYLYTSQMNQPTKALPYVERAFKHKPNDRNILDTYGWVLAALGQYTKAERFLNRSLQMGEAIAANLYHLGWVHEKTGRVTQAALRYQQALKLLADGKDDRLQKIVKEALERIKKPAAEGSGKE